VIHVSTYLPTWPHICYVLIFRWVSVHIGFYHIETTVNKPHMLVRLGLIPTQSIQLLLLPKNNDPTWNLSRCYWELIQINYLHSSLSLAHIWKWPEPQASIPSIPMKQKHQRVHSFVTTGLLLDLPVWTNNLETFNHFLVNRFTQSPLKSKHWTVFAISFRMCLHHVISFSGWRNLSRRKDTGSPQRLFLSVF
jgi:hypothetical protein